MTPADGVKLKAITIAASTGDDVVLVQLIHEYWHDLDRAERTPRPLLYAHVGLLVGTCMRLQQSRPRGPLGHA